LIGCWRASCEAPAANPQEARSAAADDAPSAVEAVDKGARAQVRADDPTKPAEFNPAGFSFAAGRGEFWTARFKLMLLGATDATDRASFNGPPLLETSLKVKRNYAHGQGSAIVAAPISRT
jgi:hypothetical protein